MLYFDHAASTPPYPEVIASVAQAMERYYANPSSLHRLGQAAEQLIGKARSVIAGALKTEPGEIYFTSGGTESNNTAIRAAARTFRSRGRHIITSMSEHASVYETCRQLEEEGFEVTYLKPDRSGRIQPAEVAAAVRDDTILVSIMHVNNETGAVQPIREIGGILANYPKTLFHVDAVQSLGKLDFNPRECGIDMFSGSAHKFRGPRGAGILYCRKGLQLKPLMTGGGQEMGLRPGTEPLPLIAGMAKALRLTIERRETNEAKYRMLRKRLTDALARIDGVVLTLPEDAWAAPHIVHFCVPMIRSEVLVHMLEERDIYVSTQSACSSGENKPSRVLAAMGLPEALTSSGVRVSLSADQSADDIDVLAAAIEDAVARLARKK
jgi:cysteine desulfurase